MFRLYSQRVALHWSNRTWRRSGIIHMRFCSIRRNNQHLTITSIQRYYLNVQKTHILRVSGVGVPHNVDLSIFHAYTHHSILVCKFRLKGQWQKHMFAVHNFDIKSKLKVFNETKKTYQDFMADFSQFFFNTFAIFAGELLFAGRWLGFLFDRRDYSPWWSTRKKIIIILFKE